MAPSLQQRLPSLVRAAIAGLALVGLGFGCGQRELAPHPPARCLKLGLPDDGLSTASPARVSLFFTLDTCDGRPMPGLSSGQFELYEDGQKVSVYESQQTIQPKGMRYKMRSLLLLDLSGSVLKSGGFPALKEAATRYVDQVLATPGGGQEVALYAFDGQVSLTQVVDFTADAAALRAGLDRLEVRQCTKNDDCAGFPDRKACAGWLCVDDSTNLNGAVVQGLQRLDAQLLPDPGLPFQDGALVVFTDGTDQSARVRAEEAASAVRESKAHTFTIGLGGEVDTSTLQRFGKDGYLPAARTEELSQAFAEIADKVVSMASRFYLLEYCSPKRSGTHALEVRVRTSDADGTPLEGSVRRSFDASRFESGCELTQP